MDDNLRQVWSHDSTAWGLIQRRIQREREEAERIEASKTEVDRFHEAALARFHARCISGDNVQQPSAREKINLAQRVNEDRRTYWRKTENGFEQLSK